MTNKDMLTRIILPYSFNKWRVFFPWEETVRMPYATETMVATSQSHDTTSYILHNLHQLEG